MSLRLVRLLSLAILCAALPRAATPADLGVYATPQRLVSLADGRRMNLYCTGRGSPTVLLEAGWSNSNLAWRSVQPLIARKTRVCSYDRAGLGFSDPADGPRDTSHIVSDLEALIHAAGLKAPYVLVGYSMGGLSMRLLADRRRAEIAGMVLVEPSGEHQAERFAAALPGRNGPARRLAATDACGVESGCGAAALPAAVQAAEARIKARPSYQKTILAELLGLNGDGADQVAASRRPYGDLPLIVLTGADNVGDPDYSPAEIAAFRSVWNSMHDEVAGLSRRGAHRQIAGATHLMVFERPDAIATAVSDVVQRKSR